MRTQKTLPFTIILFLCLFIVPSVSAQLPPGWNVGPDWNLPSYSIVAVHDAGCSITPNGVVSVAYGGNASFVYSALDGYSINQVLVDGVFTSVSSPIGVYNFTGVYTNHTITVFSAPIVSPTPSPTPVPTVVPTGVPNPHNHPTQTLNLYFESGTYNFTSLIGYGLNTDYGNNYVSLPVTTATTGATITYGFRIYVASSASNYQELTGGTPQAQISISGNQTTQTRSSGWNCPDTTVVLGAQVIKIDLYAKIDNGDWTPQATFLSNPLMTKELMPATWTFSLNLQMTSLAGNTTCIYSFGDTTYRSTVTGVTIVTPNYPDVQTWQWMQGDLIGLILGSYLAEIGQFFWVLLFVMFFGGIYLRHRSISPVVFIAVLLSAGGGFSAFVLFPPVVAAILSVFIIVALAALIFKIIR